MYSGEIVSPKGQSEIEFCYEGNKIKTIFLVTDEHSADVLGRDILGKLQLNWKDIFNLFVASEVNSSSDNVTLNKIIPAYKVIFSNELGTLKDFQADTQKIPRSFLNIFIPDLYCIALRKRELPTINTHKGLFQPTKLQFGVHSASGIFQRELENRLASIPYVKVRSDDILISGKNDVEHFNN